MTPAAPTPRVFCIGRNYAEHARELNNPVPVEPVVFMKPANALTPPGASIVFPTHGDELHHEVEIVVRIGRGGRDIPEDAAADAVDAVTVGFDLTLRDVQRRLKDKGLPWEKAKAFEGAAPLGTFVPAEGLDLADIDFHGGVGDDVRQRGNASQMLFPIPRLVAYLSTIWTLAPGDLIFTGTPSGVGPVRAGERLFAEADGIGRFSWNVLA